MTILSCVMINPMEGNSNGGEAFCHPPQTYRTSDLKTPRVVVIREEFIALTGDPLIAAVLNQLVYWSQRVTDFDLFLKEEKASFPKCRSSLQYGWFYKTAQELIEETMLCVTNV